MTGSRYSTVGMLTALVGLGCFVLLLFPFFPVNLVLSVPMTLVGLGCSAVGWKKRERAAPPTLLCCVFSLGIQMLFLAASYFGGISGFVY